jgi:hypothetical protein
MLLFVVSNEEIIICAQDMKLPISRNLFNIHYALRKPNIYFEPCSKTLLANRAYSIKVLYVLDTAHPVNVARGVIRKRLGCCPPLLKQPSMKVLPL